MSKPLEIWIEFASTYSYLSAVRVEKMCAARGAKLVWRPFLLGPIFAAQGLTDSPFNIFETKGAYMWTDMAREANILGVPFKRPSRFPQNGLLAARLSTAHVDQPWIGDFVRGVFAANFVQDLDISDPDVLRPVLADAMQGASPNRALPPMDALDAALACAQDPAVKAALKDATDEAREAGIFGAPTFRVGTEIFWGNDRLERALDAATT